MKQPIFWILSMMRLAAASEECQECQGDVPASKAGVAMLVKGNFATSATAGASVNDINTYGIEREAVLVNYLLTSRTAEFSDSVIKELASMRITPEVAAFINGTLKAMLPVFDDLEAATLNDTDTRDRMHKSFGNLTSHLNETLVKVDLEKQQAAELRSKHLDYRTSAKTKTFSSQKVLYEEMVKCSSEEDGLRETKEQKEAGLKSAENALKKLVCHDNDAVNNLKAKIATAGPYASAGRGFQEAKRVYDEKVKECNKRVSDYKERKDESNREQSKFEGSMCSMSQTAATGCAGYEAAYTTRLGDYNTLQDGIIDINSKQRQFEWKHLKGVHCALSALMKHTVDTHESLTTTIEGCASNPYAHAKLVIDRKPAPAKLPCFVLPPLPCSKEFLEVEYGTLKTGYEATDCVPCAGTTPAPAPAPADTTPAPAPAPAPAPVPTVPLKIRHPWFVEKDGKIFFFDAKDWASAFGKPLPRKSTAFVEQLRNGVPIWKGTVKVFGVNVPPYGKRVPGEAAGQWKLGDELRKADGPTP